MKLLLFELKKVLFSKKFLYIMIGILIGVIFLIGRNILFQSYIEKEAIAQIDELLEINFSNAKVHEAVLKENPDDEEEMDLQRLNSAMINNLYETRNHIASESWKERLSLENDYYATAKEYKDKGGELSLSFREISHRIALNERLLESNIPPEHEVFSTSLPNFMKQVVDIFITLGAIIIVLLLIGEIMSSEFENRSINLLFTQPLKRTHIIASKFWSSVILYIISTMFLFVIVALIGFVFGEKGAFQYPIVIEVDNVIQFLTIREYLLLGLIVVSLMIIMIATLCILFSLFFKSTLPTLFAVLGILMLGYVLSTFVTWSPLNWVNPFQYLMPEDIILYQNGRTWYQGLPAVMLWIIVLYVVAQQKIKSSKVE